MARMIGAVALGLVAIATPAQAQLRWVPEAGSHSYRYETVTHVPGAPGNSYRLDYTLVSDGKGGLVAVVKGAWHRDRDAGEWSDPEIDDACRKKLNAQGDELARITLTPLAPEKVVTLAGFMDECAPAEIFFPMTDLLKIALVQVAPQFHLAELTKPGDSRRFAGHKTQFERNDTALSLDSPGGTISLVTLTPDRATIEYAPAPVGLTTIHRRAYNGADVTLTGTDTMVMRIAIDPRSGVLLGAVTTKDNLDMTMSLPGGYSQPMAITREVTITPLP